jgi:hypothetical protein
MSNTPEFRARLVEFNKRQATRCLDIARGARRYAAIVKGEHGVYLSARACEHEHRANLHLCVAALNQEELAVDLKL